MTRDLWSEHPLIGAGRLPNPFVKQKSPEAYDLGASVRGFLWLLELGSNQRLSGESLPLARDQSET